MAHRVAAREGFEDGFPLVGGMGTPRFVTVSNTR